jgi:hypothetical protein
MFLLKPLLSSDEINNNNNNMTLMVFFISPFNLGPLVSINSEITLNKHLVGLLVKGISSSYFSDGELASRKASTYT